MFPKLLYKLFRSHIFYSIFVYNLRIIKLIITYYYFFT